MTGPDLSPPLRYEGREERATKEFLWGTHRAMPPAETLERIRPHLHKGGITRVADITGLDTVGIPVAVAIRPGSGSLAVEGGKGATFEAAMTSAAMEAIERYVAEVVVLPSFRATVPEMLDRLPAPPEDFQLARNCAVTAHAYYEWVPVWDIAHNEPSIAPAPHVRLPCDPVRLSESPWAPTSNGLASGNNLPEAICAGLYEVIERDGTSCWHDALLRGAESFLIDPASLTGEAIGTVLEQLQRAEIEPVIMWRPTEIGVPVAEAYIVDRRVRMGIYKGYGCHLDPEIAVVRAVTEAVQGRTIFVAGARDDMLTSSYEAMKRSDVFTPDQHRGNGRTMSIADVANRATGSFHGDIAVLIELLGRAGFDRVLARELDATAFDASVARVLVPGLEGYRFPWARPSRRADGFRPPEL